ncbi:MAG: nitroreductase family protein [Spirochaetales bacterium]|nr:nitroreductase family protein [Spirochaetales bacterium]
MALLPHLEKWSSARKFTGERIDREIIERIVDAGRRAPSAKNRQPWRFVVIEDPKLVQRTMDIAYGQSHVGESSHIVAACTTNIDYRMPNGQLSYPIDISFAVSFMMIQAIEEKLGSCVITTFKEEEMKQLITAPYSMRVVMLLLIGVPETDTFIQDRKSLKSIMSYNHW